ncbi:hypothetical protein [Saccharopolyspora erythraea]|uniref:hypothetical protein n=1 Tax=Saccharopolyspora erythraea TaxID=1836 RepID=UPI002011E688|nr:hypothetical protein [Saccharopolyspora erythraea]
MSNLVGAIGTHVLANLMPDRRLRTTPRVVKRALSKYNAKGSVDRTTHRPPSASMSSPQQNLDNQGKRQTTRHWI